MPALAHEVASFVLTELSSRYDALPKDSRVGGICKRLEGPVCRLTETRLGKVAINTADRVLTVADGAVDYAMTTKTYGTLEKIVLETVIPTATTATSVMSSKAAATANTVSEAHTAVVTRCVVARNTGMRQVNRGRAAAGRTVVAARNTVSKGVSSAKAGATNAVAHVRAAPGRISQAVYMAAVATRAYASMSLTRAVEFYRIIIEGASLRYLNAKEAASAKYTASRNMAVATYSKSRAYASSKYVASVDMTVAAYGSAKAAAVERYARIHNFLAGFLASVSERISIAFGRANAALAVGKQESAALAIRQMDYIKTITAPLVGYIRARFHISPGFFVTAPSTVVSFNPISSTASIEDSPSDDAENPAVDAHVDAPAQEAAQSKAEKKKNKKKNKASKQFAERAEEVEKRQVLGVRNVIADYEERLQV